MSEVETGMEGREPDAFERTLMQAMLRVDAPEGFAERAMERAAESAAGGYPHVPEAGPSDRLRAGHGASRGLPEVSDVPPATSGSRAKVLAMRPRFAWLSQRAWVGGAIAAMLVLGVFGGEQVRARHEREQAAVAQQQFEEGIRVTGQALAQTREQLERAGLRLGD